MTQDTIEGLRARVEQLEAELAEAKRALEQAGKHDHAQPGEDEEWGQFNPG